MLVRADDENKISRIIERFDLTKLDTSSLKVELEKEKRARDTAKETESERVASDEPDEKQVIERERPEKSRSDRMADDLMSAPVQKEVRTSGNPDMARTENVETMSGETISRAETSHLSEPFLRGSRSPMDRNEGRSDKSGKRKPSVRAELNDLKKLRAEKVESAAKDMAPVKKEKSKTK